MGHEPPRPLIAGVSAPPEGHACRYRKGNFANKAVNVQRCWGFIEAVQEFSVSVDQAGKTLLGACPDEDTKTVQIVKVFVDYARVHPDKLNLPAATVAYNAMADAFPCK